MATRTIANGGGNWSATGTWVEGVVPTSADDVVATGTSGQLTLDATGNCRSIDFTGYTNTFTLNANIDLNIGDASGGAMKTVAGMTLTNLGGGHFNFISTSNNGGVGWPITTGGKLMGHCVFNGSGGKWQLQDTFNVTGATQQTTLTTGTLDTNGQTVTWGAFLSSGSLTRNITLGATSLTLTVASGTAWSCTTATNLTVSAGTSTITCSGSTSTFQAGNTAQTYYNVSFTGASTATLTAGITNQVYNNVTRTGTASPTDIFNIGSDITVNGTFTVNGNSSVNRVLIANSTLGVGRTITAAATSFSNVDFQDITGAGAGSWSLAAITGLSGDCGGNSGITFTTPAAQTWSGTGGGNWTANAWTTRVPLPQDNVTLSSAFSGSPTITVNIPRSGANVDWSASTGTVTWDRGSGVTPTFYGNLTMRAGIVWGTIFTGSFTFAGRGAQTFTSAGLAISYSLIFQSIGGSYTIQDDLTVNNASAITFAVGTFNGNTFNLTSGSFTTSGSGVTINMGGGTFTTTNTLVTTVVSISTVTTVNASTSNLIISGASNSTKTLALGNHTFNNVVYNVAGSAAPLVITGANTINALYLGPGRSLSLPASTTNIINNIYAVGAANGYLYSPGINAHYISTPDSAALSFSTALTIDVKVALDNWTPAVNPNSCAFFGKWGSAATVDSYIFRIDASGRPLFTASADGSASTLNITGDTAFGFTNGTTNWVRVTFTANSASGLRFWKSPDGVNWTQVGSTVSTTVISSIFDTAQIVEIGSYSTQNNITGKIYEAKAYSTDLGSGSGTPVFDADFTQKPLTANTFTELSSNAATVTLNGAGVQCGDGCIVVKSATAATAATLARNSGTKAAGNLKFYNCAIQDITAASNLRAEAFNSTSISGNTGITFLGDDIKTANFQFIEVGDGMSVTERAW